MTFCSRKLIERKLVQRPRNLLCPILRQNASETVQIGSTNNWAVECIIQFHNITWSSKPQFNAELNSNWVLPICALDWSVLIRLFSCWVMARHAKPTSQVAAFNQIQCYHTDLFTKSLMSGLGFLPNDICIIKKVAQSFWSTKKDNPMMYLSKKSFYESWRFFTAC